MIRSLLLGAHIIAGTVGLLLGPLVLAGLRRPRWHPRLGVLYQGAVAVMTSTAVGLVVLAPGRLWGLGVVAVATEAAALAGWHARRRRRPGWLPRHIRLMCGSYLSFATAALVVSWDSVLAWLLPTALGAPLIARAAKSASRPPRPIGPVTEVARVPTVAPGSSATGARRAPPTRFPAVPVRSSRPRSKGRWRLWLEPPLEAAWTWNSTAARPWSWVARAGSAPPPRECSPRRGARSP